MACSVDLKQLGGNFHDVLDKVEADILQITKKWNYNGISSIQDTVTKRI